MPGAPAQVRARGWGWRHPGRVRWAVRGLDLDIAAGERVLLLGPSGSGKSTLLAGIAGVHGDEGDQEGTLLVAGEDSRAVPGRAGLVLQDPDSQVVLSRVGDDVAFGCENLGVPADRIWPRVREALAAVGLGLPLEHPTERLSGGQRQRLALAGALAMRPGLLLLDEPTANLDPAGVSEVRDAVVEACANTGATLIVVEHRVSVWRDVVDRVIVLGEHGILADGPPDAVLGRQGAALARAGVWVPGHLPPVPERRGGPGAGLLAAASLAVARGNTVVRAGVDLTVRAGEATVVTGPNGAGKSTLALALAGLAAPAAGSLTALPSLARGADARPWRWRSRELLTRIGTVFQNPEHQFLAATVRRELEVGPRALGLPEGEVTARVDELLQRLHLDALAEANPFSLSGGQKRRLSVGAVLASRPPLLVLDEPTFGQDALGWAELVALLAELADAGHALVAVSHDPDFVAAVADARLALDVPAREAA